jgi:sugar phosphate permease
VTPEPAAAAGPHAASDVAALDPRRFRVFALTWLSYASYYLTRKNYSVAKATLQDTFGFSTRELGFIDSTYSAAYALGQFVWGAAADRFGPRRVIGFGMLATATCSLLVGMQTGYWAMMALFTLNGFAQATGWSPNVKAMTGWFPELKRGAIMGFWTTNYSVGGFLANPVAREFMKALGWQWAFFGPAIPVAFVGLCLLLFLPEHAKGFRHAGDEGVDPDSAHERRRVRAQVLKTPFLWALGLAYFFLKLVRYFFWNWAPFYMEKVLGYDKDTAAYAPLAFDLAGVLGAITIGWASDRFFKGRRVPVAIASILLLAAALSVYGNAAAHSLGANLVVLALCGFFLFGPDAIVSATAAQDLGGPRAAAIAAGIINGLGSLGQIAAGPLAPSDPRGANWGFIFRVLGGCTAIAALILAPFWRRGRPETQAAT